MNIQGYKITAEGISKLTEPQFEEQSSDKHSLYILDVQTRDRSEAANVLRKYKVSESVLEYIQEPAEHIRFQMIEKSTYGELAYFASSSNPPLNYFAVIGYENCLFLIYDNDEKLTSEIVNELSAWIHSGSDTVDQEIVMYIIINEILTSYGKLILKYREEIEHFAKDFDREDVEIDPDKILEYKSDLSDFTSVFEKLHFTLNFPPAKDRVGKESPYQVYFGDLMKILNTLRMSLSRTEDRVNSLNNHYLLLLQEKSNRRINFLTIIQAIFVPLTLVTGIYGMNFSNMPELNFQYGYFFVLGLMVVITLVFVRYFSKHGWFD
jgi:magnesium/cobalt transport protein CorA